MERGLSFRGNTRRSTRRWCGRPGRSCRATGDLAALLPDRLLDGHQPAGATPASFMSYGIAKARLQARTILRQGEIEGVVAPETAAHAAGTSALLPMLSLGVPGSTTAAVLLGGLLIWGMPAGTTAVRGTEGLRLGSHRQHVSRQRRGPDHRAHLRAAVCRDPAGAVQHHGRSSW